MLTVITKSGYETLKDKCTLIDNEWYIKGKRNKLDSGEAYKVGSLYWYKSTDCYYNKKRQLYCRLTDAIVKGLIKPNGELEYFRKDKYTVKTIDGFYIKDYREFPKYYYRAGTDIFHASPTATVENYGEFNTRLYGADNNAQFDIAWAKYIQESKHLSKVNEVFDYTYGVEFETSEGALHPNMMKDTYLVPVKDGSIGGYEYITVPMSGELSSLKEQCYYLSRQCSVDEKTSTHIHIGNLPRTKEFAVSFYLLMYRFQNEINAMFPPFKKMLSALTRRGRDAKDYCKLLPELNLAYGRNYILEDGSINQESLNKAFTDIWTFWNDGVPPTERSNPENRTHSKNGNQKWHYTNRYSIINMNNYFFTDSRTIEFRYHEGTLNYGKVSNWLLLNIAFIKFATNNSLEILKSNTKITFKDILQELNNEDLQSHLLKYVCDRKTEMANYYSAQIPYYEIFLKDKEVQCTWKTLN